MFGGLDVLCYEDVLVFELCVGEVLVCVYVVGLNLFDWYFCDGYKMLLLEWQLKVDFFLILGMDIFGVIEVVVEDVDGFLVGDEVYVMVWFLIGFVGGSWIYVEYVSVLVFEVVCKLVGIDYMQVVVVLMFLLIVWQFLVDLGYDVFNLLQLNQYVFVVLVDKIVFVNGVVGGVGYFVVQVVKLKGVWVIVVVLGKYEVLLCGLGVDEVIDYMKLVLEDVVCDVDFVVDVVGGLILG